jgi:hypothetical protein
MRTGAVRPRNKASEYQCRNRGIVDNIYLSYLSFVQAKQPEGSFTNIVRMAASTVIIVARDL